MTEKSAVETDILVVGAGASGLMVARELAKIGKKIIILEARNRIGGRIYALPSEEFGYPVQGGAEFVHGEAKYTKILIKEAGLTFVPSQENIWSIRDGKLIHYEEFMPYQDMLHEKLKKLEEDMPIGTFLEKYFPGETYAELRNTVIRMVEGYDAADPYKISSFSLREAWLGEEEWQQGKIKEGYGALIDFLASQCTQTGVEIKLNKKVISIETKEGKVEITSADNQRYYANKIVITIPLPTISSINFDPALPEKIEAASKIGFGHVIKLILKFKDRWWINARGKDLSTMTFMLSNEKFTTWWTQYPEINPILTGWMAGPTAKKYKDASDNELLDIALTSLSNIFDVKEEKLKSHLVHWKVINWPADPFTQGAYSYTMAETGDAREKLAEPVANTIYFAGEALCNGDESATVEGALASGKETAERILKP